MKAIMISIKPKWVVDILNHKKTIEVRKSMPKCDLPIDVYIYCTKSNYFGYISKRYIGKVVAKFTLNKVEEIIDCVYGYRCGDIPHTNQVARASCLSFNNLRQYLKGKNGYAWHISNLVILKPKELNEFSIKGKYTCSKTGCPYFATNKCRCASECLYEKPLTKAPQSYMFIEVE